MSYTHKTFQLTIDEKIQPFLDSLQEVQRARIYRYAELFAQYGTHMPGKYIKKVSHSVWELRPGDIRLLLGIMGNTGIVVHAFKKKSQKLPKKHLQTAHKRLLNYKL